MLLQFSERIALLGREGALEEEEGENEEAGGQGKIFGQCGSAVNATRPTLTSINSNKREGLK